MRIDSYSLFKDIVSTKLFSIGIYGQMITNGK